MEELKYDIILFDSDETIFDYKRAEEFAIKGTLGANFSLSDDQLHHAYRVYSNLNRALWDKYHRGLLTKQQILNSRFVELFTELQLHGNAVSFGKQYLRKLSEAQFLMPGIEDVLKQLFGHCHMAVVTNGVAEVHRTRIANSPIREYIGKVVVSSDLGIDKSFQKPNTDIFKYAHRSVDPAVPLCRILMIGDNLESDVKGSQNYQIHSCWYNPGKIENKTLIIPDYEISEWNELLEIVME